MTQNRILRNLDNPEILEELYRHDTRNFHGWFQEAVQECPDSDVLKTWRARLSYGERETHQASIRRLVTVIFISLAALFLIKLPDFTPINESWFDTRFEILIVIGSVFVYFICFSMASLSLKFRTAVGFMGCIVVMGLMPEMPQSASLTMSKIHLPLVLFSLLAMLYMADEWKNPEARVRYIRFIGEVLIYAILIVIGGIILSLLTYSLFNLINLSIDWYGDYVVVWGLVSAPLVATYVYDTILNRDSRLTTLFANIFAPLVLIIVIGYLLMMAYTQKSPFSDRDFLVTLNGLLIVVWGITALSIIGRKYSFFPRITDPVNIALVGVTLIINIIALAALSFRFVEFGVTPNRIAALGVNLLIFGHLIEILRAYLRQYKSINDGDFLVSTIANYLPIYSLWSVFVVFFLPLLFWFR